MKLFSASLFFAMIFSFASLADFEEKEITKFYACVMEKADYAFGNGSLTKQNAREQAEKIGEFCANRVDVELNGELLKYTDKIIDEILQ